MLFAIVYPEAAHLHDIACGLDPAQVTEADFCDALDPTDAADAVRTMSRLAGWDESTGWESVLFYPCVEFGRLVVAPPAGDGLPVIPKRGLIMEEKAGIISNWAKEHGWDVVDLAGIYEYNRGEEFIQAVWKGNAWDGAMSIWVYRDQTVRLASAREALSRLASAPGEDEMPEEAPRKPERPRAPLPFDGGPDGDADAYIIEMVVGRRIYWTNSISEEEESAQLFPEGRDPKTGEKYNKQTKIEVTKTGRRVLTFCEPGGAFRSVALDSILEVKG